MKKLYNGLAFTLGISLLTLIPLGLSPAHAGGITLIDEGDKKLEIGGRIQLQYHISDPDVGQSKDEVFFRRFRPYIQGSIHKNWIGKFEWDMGQASDDNEMAVKDAYMQYQGFPNMTLTLGNSKTPFSREFLTSSKEQQLVERTFVGDHNYGSPDRMMGLKLDGHASDKMIEYSLAFGNESIDPDNKKLDFDSPANKNNDFNEGWLGAARIDFHPLGHLKKSQGDFERTTKATIGLGVFTWNNDDDNNSYTDAAGNLIGTGKADVDKATGYEVSAAIRAMGLSVDAQYNSVDADTIDPTVTGGIYKNGSTTLKSYAVEAGFMVVPSKVEVVAGYQSQDADNYVDAWTRTSLGLNVYFEKHDVKLQSTYQMGENLDGQKNNDRDEVFVQMQYVF